MHHKSDTADLFGLHLTMFPVPPQVLKSTLVHVLQRIRSVLPSVSQSSLTPAMVSLIRYSPELIAPHMDCLESSLLIHLARTNLGRHILTRNGIIDLLVDHVATEWNGGPTAERALLLSRLVALPEGFAAMLETGKRKCIIIISDCGHGSCVSDHFGTSERSLLQGFSAGPSKPSSPSPRSMALASLRLWHAQTSTTNPCPFASAWVFSLFWLSHRAPIAWMYAHKHGHISSSRLVPHFIHSGIRFSLANKTASAVWDANILMSTVRTLMMIVGGTACGVLRHTAIR